MGAWCSPEGSGQGVRPWEEVTLPCLQLLTSNVVNDLMLLESLLDNLAARQKDPCASVRRLVLRGLANLASGSPDKVSCPPAPGVDCEGQWSCGPGDPGRCGGCVWRLPGARGLEIL